MIETNEKSLDVEFHNELVHQYVDVTEKYYNVSSKTEVPIDRETSGRRKSLRTRLMNFLSSENARYDAKQMLEEFPHSIARGKSTAAETSGSARSSTSHLCSQIEILETCRGVLRSSL